ncbi:MAG: hypothetical protein CM1200mP29_15090 [Verrucomicrobiota bacterium]|nr:MAG: hypothetical protein CM1200mP29_15090 [Verrucomicrobiota bacterium]
MHARSIRSPLDSVLNVYGPDGKNIQGNDDSSGSADSRVTVALPADGKHFIRVTDHLRKGGEDYVYRVEAKPVAPELATFIPRFRAQDTQSRQMMPIPRGNRIATVLQVTRGNFGGPLKFAADKLPDGITMHAAEMPPNIDRFPVVFEAKPEADWPQRWSMSTSPTPTRRKTFAASSATRSRWCAARATGFFTGPKSIGLPSP